MMQHPKQKKKKKSELEVVSSSTLSSSTVHQPKEKTENDQFRD